MLLKNEKVQNIIGYVIILLSIIFLYKSVTCDNNQDAMIFYKLNDVLLIILLAMRI